jgi:hypothetical protein
MKCHHFVLHLAVAAVLVLLVGAAEAQSCTARHANGGLVAVRERPGPSMFWAHASMDPDGWPAITYGPTFYQLPPIMQRLTVLHECAHLVERTTNEFHANCKALSIMRQQGLTMAEEQYIKRFHIQIGSLGPQYGGSGAAFWAGTLQVCGPR